MFVGIDVIDGYLTEINVTSPTGIRAIKRLGGPDLAVAIWDAIEAAAPENAARDARRLAGGPGKGNIPDMSAVAAPLVERRSRAARTLTSERIDAKLLDQLAALATRIRDDAAFRRAGDRGAAGGPGRRSR